MTGRVLVVDDEPTMRDLLETTLSEEGYEVRTAANGREALQVDAAWRPDLVVLDLMMPVMDGWAFLAERARSSAQAPVLVVSAVRGQGRPLGADVADFFAKPFDIERLLRRVSELVPDRGAEPSLS
ncbi:MAG TPA: response regulator transcription factor [Candidatus Limnocylindrales bacterium]|nr:response regulator transcription factor [Candidatus Limnocylindrales bacterium]